MALILVGSLVGRQVLVGRFEFDGRQIRCQASRQVRLSAGWLARCWLSSPGGKLVVSGSGDDTVRLWDAATGAPHGEPLKGHSDSVSWVAFSPDGKLVAVSDWVTKDAEKLLWLPPDYRATCGDVWDSLLVLGHSSGAVSIFQFN